MKTKNSVLLIDDDKINNYINIRLFKKLTSSWDVFIARNGKDALRHLGNSNSLPDLILLDIEMPVMNGMQFLKEFYNTNLEYKKDVRLIILTATFHPDHLDQFNEYPIHSCISKPLTSEKLEGILGNIISYNETINHDCLSFAEPKPDTYTKPS